MSDTPVSGGSTGPTGPDEQFTVPVPHVPRGPGAGAAGPTTPAAAAPTQAIPVFEPTRELPTADPSWPAPAPTAPPVPPNPYAGQPVWPATPSPSRAADETVDPLLGQIGVALFWITVGWWLFVLIRVLGFLTRHGVTDTILIRTIDLGAEETVVAAVLSVLAALLLLLGRGRAGRSPLGWASLALAVVTVGVAVWRLLP
ncbi:hypothetical protein [Terracoccus sp. 273MFTsu3.1]|uniref:hypothetical protein n=1 Tax=Terracoccus sp. 273MFTsu3.1 TaxID=1172188 RepID=UPI0003A41D32|nr:hypothetical protein [Terracoccus sp. 273MFTsu3.1]